MKIRAFITTLLLLFSIDQALAKVKTDEESRHGVEPFTFPTSRKRLIPRQILANKKKEPTTHHLIRENDSNDFERNLELATRSLQGVFGFFSSDDDSETGGVDTVVEEMNEVDDDGDGDMPINPDYFIFGMIIGTMFPPAIPFVWILWLFMTLFNTFIKCDDDDPDSTPSPSVSTVNPTKNPTPAPSVFASSSPSITNAPSLSALPSAAP